MKKNFVFVEIALLWVYLIGIVYKHEVIFL